MVDTENDPNSTIPCIYGYSYNKTIFHSTIVSEWNLVCGHQRFIDLSQITLMLGILTGKTCFYHFLTLVTEERDCKYAVEPFLR